MYPGADIAVAMTSAQPKRRRNDDDTPPKAMTVPGDVCGHCNKKCTTKGKSSEAIQCDVCFEWVHAQCEGYSKEQYKLFAQLTQTFPNIAYCCKLHGCLTRLNQLTANDTSANESGNKRIEEIAEKHSLISQSITDLSSQIQNLSLNSAALESKFNNLIKSTQLQKNPPASNTFIPTSVAVDVADEISERDKRKCNLIVHNLPEEPLDNHHTDADTFLELCKTSLDLHIDITKAVRLGQKSNTKTRSLLIKVNDEESQKQILAHAPKLRFSKIWSRVYIQPDMSPKEREAHKKLYEELKRRRNQGENNLVIRHGKIVPYVPRTYRTRTITNPVHTGSNTNASLSATAMESDTSAVNKPASITEPDVPEDHEIRLDS